jgi:hypothetical protein
MAVLPSNAKHRASAGGERKAWRALTVARRGNELRALSQNTAVRVQLASRIQDFTPEDRR